jgi:glutamate-5-semialdehyde dehydrogenase
MAEVAGVAGLVAVGQDAARPGEPGRPDAADGGDAAQPAGPDAAVEAVRACAEAAHAAASSIAAASPDAVDAALRGIADRLDTARAAVLEANAADLRAGEDGGLPAATLDRLRLDADRLAGMADQLRTLAAVPHPQWRRVVRELPDAVVEEHRRPVGVVGANFEARPNVVVDVASQLLKSRNAGVLRTGSAAIRSAAALVDEVVAPALADAGLDPAAVQLVRLPGRDTARALVALPGLVPLVILRGSGASTRELTAEAARHGVRTLAHADGGGVLYLDRAADRGKARRLVAESLDRLGVCNRLNLLLVAEDTWDDVLGDVLGVLDGLGLRASLPPHPHPLGHEWALDEGREPTVTVAPVTGPVEAARLADAETSGLAATIVTEDPAAAADFLAAYTGTGAFWNVSTRLLDGFKLLGVPETGINVDRVPGPRGPVTFPDLHLRQFVVTPR